MRKGNVIDYRELLKLAIEDIPHGCNYCGLRGDDHNYCEYHDRDILPSDITNGCGCWKWKGLCSKNVASEPVIKISFDETEHGNFEFREFEYLSDKEIDQLCFEIGVIAGEIKDKFNPMYDSQIRLLVDDKEWFYLVEFNIDDLKKIRKDVIKYKTEK